MAAAALEIVVPCKDAQDWADTLAFLTRPETFAFQVVTIFPADSPRVAVLARVEAGVAESLRLRLVVDQQGTGSYPKLTLQCVSPDAQTIFDAVGNDAQTKNAKAIGRDAFTNPLQVRMPLLNATKAVYKQLVVFTNTHGVTAIVLIHRFSDRSRLQTA